MAKYGRLGNDDKFVEKQIPHLQYQDTLHNTLSSIEIAIKVVEMYQSHEQHFLGHLTAVKEMLEARIDDE